MLTTHPYTQAMPTRSKLKSSRLIWVTSPWDSVSLACARNADGRKEIAEKTGLVQELVSNYETDKLRLNADMDLRFAEVLDDSTDELLREARAQQRRRNSPASSLSAAWNRLKLCRSMSSAPC